MAISAVTVLKVRPGKEKEIFETLKTVKKIVEHAGRTYSVSREVVGPQPNHIIAVAQYPDWSHVGKVRSDSELQKTMERVRSSSDPAAEVVTTTIFEDVAI